ncbi:glycoside hydrolase family 2 TIM barrel-domain containing protein [Propionibacteriaceae bacterium Y1685]
MTTTDSRPLDTQHELRAEIARVGPSTGTTAPRAWLHTDAPTVVLDGTWQVRFSPSARQVPDDDWTTDSAAGEWGELEVPGHWSRQPGGTGKPWYTNVRMPFPSEPPYVPDENVIGDHLTTFTLDGAYLPHAVLRFHGVESAAIVWLNGQQLGTIRGSRLMHEFDISGVAVEGENVLAVRVLQWSANTWAEDQDMWWLPGIFRSVEVQARPVGGIDDVFVHASYDHTTGEGTLSVEATTAGESITARVTSDVLDLPDGFTTGNEVTLPVEPWSAESPQRYEIVVATDAETVRLQIGFRTVEIIDAQVLVNGSPLLLRGMNRHEFDPDHGRHVSPERAREELLIMKQHNINAVRTSHYPPAPWFCDLTDELGMWVMLENDLETHTFYAFRYEGDPTSDPDWEEALLDRMQRTVERDKNHPSIVFWSLGNEAHPGPNLDTMAKWTKQRDSSRPLHFERDQECEHLDLWSQMYVPVEEMERIGQFSEDPLEDAALQEHRATLPFVQCEYGHALGTGPGGLSEYQELFEKYPRLLGGFIWEWIDHGFRETDEKGREFFAYGGDFGEPWHDGTFISDGSVFPDLTPKPALIDFKKVVEPVRMSIDGSTLTITNYYGHIDTSGLKFVWSSPSGNGQLAVEPVPAGSTVTIPLPDLVGEGLVTVSAQLGVDQPWASAGHEVAWAQRVPAPDDVPTVSGAAVDEKLAYGPAQFDAHGRLTSLFGTAVEGPALVLDRAATDNDLVKGHAYVGDAPADAIWARQSLEHLKPRLLSFTAENDGSVVVTQRWAGFTEGAVVTESRWTSDGDQLRLDWKATPNDRWGDYWARIGVELVLDRVIKNVEWTGRGPGQAYPDCGQAARHGTWSATVYELQVPYLRPQESGARAEVTDLVLQKGFGVSGAPFAFTVRPWSQAELEAAAHPSDLPETKRTHLIIDAAQHGVGSAACGPGVLESYVLTPRESTLTLLFRKA